MEDQPVGVLGQRLGAEGDEELFDSRLVAGRTPFVERGLAALEQFGHSLVLVPMLGERPLFGERVVERADQGDESECHDDPGVLLADDPVRDGDVKHVAQPRPGAGDFEEPAVTVTMRPRESVPSRNGCASIARSAGSARLYAVSV